MGGAPCPKPTRKHTSNRNPIPQELLDEVWSRDRNICQYCGAYCGETIPHHLVFGGTGRKRIHRMEILITLCLKHHSEAHSSKTMREWTYAWSRALYGGVVDELLQKKWSGEK